MWFCITNNTFKLNNVGMSHGSFYSRFQHPFLWPSQTHIHTCARFLHFYTFFWWCRWWNMNYTYFGSLPPYCCFGLLRGDALVGFANIFPCSPNKNIALPVCLLLRPSEYNHMTNHVPIGLKLTKHINKLPQVVSNNHTVSEQIKWNRENIT